MISCAYGLCAFPVGQPTVCSPLQDEPSSGPTSAARVRVYVINSLNALMRALIRIMQSSRLASPPAACRLLLARPDWFIKAIRYDSHLNSQREEYD